MENNITTGKLTDVVSIKEIAQLIRDIRELRSNSGQSPTMSDYSAAKEVLELIEKRLYRGISKGAKFTQILAHGSSLYALDNSGTVWIHYFSKGWERLNMSRLTADEKESRI